MKSIFSSYKVYEYIIQSAVFDDVDLKLVILKVYIVQCPVFDYVFLKLFVFEGVQCPVFDDVVLHDMDPAVLPAVRDLPRDLLMLLPT